MTFYENGKPKPLRLLSEDRIRWYIDMLGGEPPTDELKTELEKRDEVRSDND